MGFEPTRAEPIGLAVQRLNHSATSSVRLIKSNDCTKTICDPKTVSQAQNHFYLLNRAANYGCKFIELKRVYGRPAIDPTIKKHI